MQAWEAHDPTLTRPIAAPLEQCAELLGFDLDAIREAAANRQLIAVMRQRLAAGEEVARMYQEPGMAWLERQAEAAEQLLAERQAGEQNS